MDFKSFKHFKNIPSYNDIPKIQYGKILYFDIELKKLWNMKVMVIPIVIGTLGTIPKGLEKKLEELEIIERIKTTQTTAVLGSNRILHRVMETWGDLLSQTASNSGVKNYY